MKVNAKKRVDIYTDGACRGNPGPGGWGAVLYNDGQQQYLQGAEVHTTNNRMELYAAIAALEYLPKGCEVYLSTDSKYLKQGMTEWMRRWKLNGWRTANKQTVKNADLWHALDELNQQHTVHWCWVKAHAGHPDNELADSLAREAIDQAMQAKQDQ